MWVSLKRKEMLVLASEGGALKIALGQVRRIRYPVFPQKKRFL